MQCDHTLPSHWAKFFIINNIFSESGSFSYYLVGVPSEIKSCKGGNLRSYNEAEH